MSKKMPEIDLADAVKVTQTKQLQKQIQAMYKKVAKNLAKEAEKLSKDGTISDTMKRNYLNQYIISLNKEIDDIELKLNGAIQSSMSTTAKAVVDANIEFMGRAGLNLKGAFDTVPKDVVEALASGHVYKSDWTLSKAIWGTAQKTKSDIEKVIAQGIAGQKSTYDIAKDLEKYVDPAAKKPWDWSKVYPGTAKKVDYNAQRIARTMVQHAYQQTFRTTISKNPFITGVIWHSVFSTGRTCQMCMDRDGQHYDKGKEPLDHPNGLCYLEPEIPSSFDDIGERLANWANGASDPEIDKWLNSAFEEGKKGKKTYNPVTRKMKKAQKKERALTQKQLEKAKEWDAAYENVRGFAKERGMDLDKAVASIIGKPPKGSKHYKGVKDEIGKTYKNKKKIQKFEKKFPTEDMGEDEANKYVKEQINNLKYSKKAQSAFDDYMMYSDDINGYLRGYSPWGEEYKASIAEIDKAMKPLSKTEVVYKGCDSKVLGINPELSEEEIKNKLLGTIYRDKGYTSTSKTSKVAEKFSDRGIDDDYSELKTIMTITVPEGKKVVYVNSGLGEIVLERGTSFKIIGAKKKGDFLYVNAEVV